MYCIQHCFICRPSDSTVLEDAGMEPRTVATSALAVRRSNHSARSYPESASFIHYSARSHPQTRLDLIHKLDLIRIMSVCSMSPIMTAYWSSFHDVHSTHIVHSDWLHSSCPPAPVLLLTSNFLLSTRAVPFFPTGNSLSALSDWLYLFPVCHILTNLFLSASLLPVCQLPVCQLPVCHLPVFQPPVCQLPVCQLPVCQLPVCQLPVCQLPVCQLPVSQLPVWLLSIRQRSLSACILSARPLPVYLSPGLLFPVLFPVQQHPAFYSIDFLWHATGLCSVHPFPVPVPGFLILIYFGCNLEVHYSLQLNRKQ